MSQSARSGLRLRVAIVAAIVAGGVFVPDTPVRSQNAISSLIRTINTSIFQPPSPDPSGLTFLPDNTSLLLSDSEVNEIPGLFKGTNLYRVSLNGPPLLGTSTTIPFSDEPAGVEVARTASGLKMFVADDAGGSRIYVVNAGIDDTLGTADDAVTSFRTRKFGSSDPEGLAFGRSTLAFPLFIADGKGAEIYRVGPGPNGKFDGVDDRVSSFDTLSLGLSDPEGVAYNNKNGHLYIVGLNRSPVGTVPRTRTPTLIEVTNRGVLVQTIDISQANARHPDGLAYGPSSKNPMIPSFYIADRGVDNNSNPNENDGKIYEMTVPAPPPPR